MALRGSLRRRLFPTEEERAMTEARYLRKLKTKRERAEARAFRAKIAIKEQKRIREARRTITRVRSPPTRKRRAAGSISRGLQSFAMEFGDQPRRRPRKKKRR